MSRAQIGRWRLGEVLGEGGMGTVYLASHLTLETAAAAKMLSLKLSRDPRFRERFLREARAQAHLRHPGVAQVFDFIEEDDDLCIVVEYLPGGTLASRLEAGKPLPAATALAWARQALDGLDHAHRRGVIHRDVKPSNIMFDAADHAKVVDFGIALMLDGRRLTTTGDSLGTPHYMSPEQIRRPGEVDHRTDVYSMGVVLYEMLAGRPPFEGDSEFDIQAAQVHEPPRPLREINPAVAPEIEAIVVKALEKDPNARYSGCGELARALAPHEGTVKPEEPPPLPVPPPVPPKPSSSSGLKWLAGVLGAAAALAFFLFLAKSDALQDERETRAQAESKLRITEAQVRTTEAELQEARTREQATLDLAAAKSWPWVTGSDFDISSRFTNPAAFYQGSVERPLVQGSLWRFFTVFRWRLKSLAEVIFRAPGGGTSQASGAVIYATADIEISGNNQAYGALVLRVGESGFYSYCATRNRYSLWLIPLPSGTWRPVKDWTASTAIRSKGFNRLSVIAQGDTFRLFINDQYLAEVRDSTLGSGEVGLAVGFSDAGQSAVVDFDNFELRRRPS